VEVQFFSNLDADGDMDFMSALNLNEALQGEEMDEASVDRIVRKLVTSFMSSAVEGGAEGDINDITDMEIDSEVQFVDLDVDGLDMQQMAELLSEMVREQQMGGEAPVGAGADTQVFAFKLETAAQNEEVEQSGDGEEDVQLQDVE